MPARLARSVAWRIVPFVDRLRASSRRVHLDSAALVVAAMKRSNLVEMDVAPIAERLEILTRSLDREASLTIQGRRDAHRDLVDLLVERARLLDAILHQPRLTTTPFDPPIVLAGLPAAGLDLLGDLLAADRGLRTPTPPDLGSLDLASWEFELRWNVPAYAEWIDRADLTNSYRLARAQLSRSQSSEPAERWVLASPQHVERTAEIASVFPGATVVRLHRDPVVVVTELARDVAERRGSASAVVNPSTIGRYWSWRFGRMAQRALDAGSPTELTFVDVQHADLVGDPIGTVDRVLSRAGRTLDAAARSTLSRVIAGRPAERIVADPAAFGIDPADLRRRIAPYSTGHDVRPEI